MKKKHKKTHLSLGNDHHQSKNLENTIFRKVIENTVKYFSNEKRNVFLSAIFVFLAALLVYINNYDCSFHFDDKHVIRENREIKNPAFFKTWKLFANRSLGFATFARDWQQFLKKRAEAVRRPDFKSLSAHEKNTYLRDLELSGYHLTSNLFHAVNAVLVFFFIYTLLKLPKFKFQFTHQYRCAVAFLCSLLFAVHPVQVMGVTYLTQRFVSGATFFYMIGAISYLVSRTFLNQFLEIPVPKDSADSKSFYSIFAGLFAAVSFTGFLLAYYFKEIGITYPAFVILSELFLIQKPELKIPERRYRLIQAGMTFLFLIPFAIHIYTASPFSAYLKQRLANTNATAVQQGEKTKSKKVTFDDIQLGETQYADKFSYALTQPRVIMNYFRMILLPYGLNIDHDVLLTDIRYYRKTVDPKAEAGKVSIIPPPRSIPKPEQRWLLVKTILSSAVLLIILGLALILHFRLPPFGSLAFFGIAWMLASLSLESSIFPLRDVLFEHRLYLSLSGFFLLMISALIALFPVLRKSALYLMIPGMIVALIFGVMTFKRNIIWKTEISVWSDAVKKNPQKPRPVYNLGFAYKQNNETLKAKKCFETTIKLDNKYIRAYNNLGLCHYQLYMDAYQKWQMEFRRSQAFLSRPPEQKTSFFVSEQESFRDTNRHHLEKAISVFNGALQVNDKFHKAYNNMGICYQLLGDTEKAFSLFKLAVEKVYEYPDGHFNLGLSYDRLGDFKKAYHHYMTAYKFNPGMKKAKDRAAVTLQRFAQKLVRQKKMREALNVINQGVKQNPQNDQIYFTRAMIYNQLKLITEAKNDVSKAIQINPRQPAYPMNLGILLYREKRYKDALHWFRQALKINPNHQKARRYMIITQNQLVRTQPKK